MSFVRRFTSLFREKQLGQELQDEMRSHIELRTKKNIEGGMSPQKAREEAI